MPLYEFTITAPATVSARVKVEADSIGEAHEIALKPSFYQDPDNVRFELDDENVVDSAYLPDSEDWEEAETPSPKA